eukprot:COSAG02_NODE_18821_length_916_cov_83.955936_1_plen_20_part_10
MQGEWIPFLSLVRGSRAALI